jgi:hypothetical protein
MNINGISIVIYECHQRFRITFKHQIDNIAVNIVLINSKQGL